MVAVKGTDPCHPFWSTRLPLFSFLEKIEDELNRDNSNPAFNIHFSRLLKGCVSDNWDQLNVICFCGLGRYLHHGEGDSQKVVKKSFEEQSAISLNEKFQL